MSGADRWIDEAEKRGIGWWATSALESNIGLEAIARWLVRRCGTANLELPQGLGTDNFIITIPRRRLNSVATDCISILIKHIRFLNSNGNDK